MSERNAKDYIYLTIGSAFGLGLLPFAPGTFGTILGVFIHLSIVNYFPSNIHMIALVIVFLIICTLNNLLTPWATEYWQSEDPRQFVLDEVAGYLLIPICFYEGALWQIVLWGFLLFRIFDIIKIPPARQIDRKLKNSWGILLDDLVSTGYAILLMYVLVWLGPEIGYQFFTPK